MMYPRITPCLDIAGIRCHWIRNVVELVFLAVTDSGGSVGTSNVEIMNQIAKKPNDWAQNLTMASAVCSCSMV